MKHSDKVRKGCDIFASFFYLCVDIKVKVLFSFMVNSSFALLIISIPCYEVTIHLVCHYF